MTNELSYEFTNDLKPGKLGNIRKILKLSPPKKQTLNFSRSALLNKNMKTRVCLKYFVSDCPWKQLLASNLLQTPSNLLYLTIFVTLMPLALFNIKLEQLICKKALNIRH